MIAKVESWFLRLSTVQLLREETGEDMFAEVAKRLEKCKEAFYAEKEAARIRKVSPLSE